MFRRLIAQWLCPDLVLESDRLFRIRAEISDKIRWLGHEYPSVEVVLSRILVDDLNWARKIDEPARDLTYPNLGGRWPSDIASFRDKMRRHFLPNGAKQWRCFHCGDLFDNEADARDHFGPDTEWQPGCIDPLTKDEKDRRHDQVAMYQELDGERQKNSELMDRDYVLTCFERDLAKLFNGAKSVAQAYLVLDAMEGRALAAEQLIKSQRPEGS